MFQGSVGIFLESCTQPLHQQPHDPGSGHSSHQVPECIMECLQHHICLHFHIGDVFNRSRKNAEDITILLYHLSFFKNTAKLWLLSESNVAILYGKNTLHKPPSHLRLGFAHDFTPGPAPHHNEEFVHVLAVETNWLHPQSLTA